MPDSKNCRFGGGNDYLACQDCGVEYDYRKEPRPACGAERKRQQLLDHKAALEKQLWRLPR